MGIQIFYSYLHELTLVVEESPQFGAIFVRNSATTFLPLQLLRQWGSRHHQHGRMAQLSTSLKRVH